MPSLKEHLHFVSEFFKDKKVASITPTSKHAVKEICRILDFEERKVVVEYGPGTGVFSTYLLERLSPDSKLILIEQNEEFVEILRKIRDPRLYIYHGSAEHVREILADCNESQADVVISGIPFSMIPKDITMQILRSTRDMLAPDGTFIVYQVHPKIGKDIKKIFRSVRRRKVLRNVPPLMVFEASK